VDQLQELYIKVLLCEIGDNERSAFKGISALERQLPTFSYTNTVQYDEFDVKPDNLLHILSSVTSRTSGNV
jgi:hypothetical protein